MSTSSHRRWLQRLQERVTTVKTAIFEPLPGDNYIRVLEILPGQGTDKICCRLHITPIDRANDTYTAISYVWGDPTETVEILVNEMPIDITISLADALRALRCSRKARRVWADAICINQQDDTEKGRQVKIMGKVYENAVDVLAWLGQESEETAQDCFNLIQDTNKYLGAQYDLWRNWDSIPKFTPDCLISRDSARWAKVSRLLRLPWFGRAWVIQEVALAKKCDLMWGTQRMNIAELCEISCWVDCRNDLWELLRGQVETGLVAYSFFDGYRSYENRKSWKEDLPLIQQQSKNRHVRHFLDVLRMGRFMEVSFDIDRVYAFLGSPLARRSDPPGQLIIEPDYNKTVDEVYYEAAYKLLEHPVDGPYLLASVDHHSERCINAHKFPSWAPRWDKGWRQNTMCRSAYWYQAGGLNRRFDAHAQQDKSLLLDVVTFDKLVWTSDHINHQNFSLNPEVWDDHIHTTGIPFIRSLWNQVVQAANVFPEDCQPTEAFRLTLTQCYPTRESPVEDGVKLAEHQRSFNVYWQIVHGEIDISNLQDLPGDPYDFMSNLNGLQNRKFAITQSGLFCIAPHFARSGDVCCICPGMKVPLILRPREDGKFGLVGDSYIHSVMSGKIIEQLDSGEVKLNRVVIV